MVIISLRFSPCTLAAQTCSLKLHPWSYHLLGAQQARRKRRKIAWPTWENTSDPAKEALSLPSRRYSPSRYEGALRTSADGLVSDSTGQEQREQPPAAVPASTHFLPLPFVCQACLQDLCFALRTYSRSLHDTAQFSTKCILYYLATSVGGILVETPALPTLSPLLWNQSFQKLCPLHIWNSSECGSFCSPFQYTRACVSMCMYSFFKMLYMF